MKENEIKDIVMEIYDIMQSKGITFLEMELILHELHEIRTVSSGISEALEQAYTKQLPKLSN